MRGKREERTAACSELSLGVSACFQQGTGGHTNVMLAGRGVLRGDGCSAIVGWTGVVGGSGSGSEDDAACIGSVFT